MKIAIVHDQLQEFGGAERVLVSLHSLFPDADVYTSFYTHDSLGAHASHIPSARVKASWADRVPFMKKLYSPLRFITPLIWESLDLSAYDLVISSSGSYMCKGVITRPETLHICYLHHPPRYLYYYETAREWQKYWPIRVYGHLINHGLRMWDYLSSQRVDFFIANSEETKSRVEKLYRRTADVIYPPVSIPEEAPQYKGGSYYLTVSRLARAKHIDLLIETANKYAIPLRIVGTGRDEEYLKSIAGKNIEFMGNVSDAELKKLYANAKAFLFASVDEEFGIAPIEAMGHGVPVIALKSGGLKETVHEGKNGYLFNALESDLLWESIQKIESASDEQYMTMRKNARKAAEQYTEERFHKEILAYVKKHMKK